MSVRPRDTLWHRAAERIRNRPLALFCFAVVGVYLLIGLLGVAGLLPDYQERVAAPPVHRAQPLTPQAMAYPFRANLQTLLMQRPHQARPTITAPALRMQGGHLRIEQHIGPGPHAGTPGAPL